MGKRTININVPVLARVEGEGALELKIHGQHIDELRLRIYEPPRYFEKLLEGRNYYDIPDSVARICGICPVAYQMSAVQAIESIFQAETSPWTRAMRRVMYCGEWLQSHSLHIHMLAAPDFLGFNSIIEMAEHHAAEVRRGLMLQTLGNELITLFGGRSVHPVGVCTGGFYKAPSTESVSKILARLQAAVPDAEALVGWAASLDLPDIEQDFVSVALRHETQYPLNEGRIVSDQGLDIGIDEFEAHFRESQVPHSTALHCLLHDRPYLLGPLARINLNRDRLPAAVSTVMDATGIRFPSRNMFHSIVARAVEIHLALVEAISLLENYSVEKSDPVEPKHRAACSGTATNWMPMVGSNRCALCHPPARTRRALKRIFAVHSSSSVCSAMKPSCACTPRKSSVIMTPVFPVQHIFCDSMLNAWLLQRCQRNGLWTTK